MELEPVTSEQVIYLLGSVDATIRTAEEARKLYDKPLAIEFNPMLHFFKPGENKISDILAFFLKPNEKHGQGDVYLRSFWKRFVPETWDAPTFSKVDIFREHWANGGRLDLYISIDNGAYRLGIENKLWAGDQRNQLTDYLAFLKDQCTDGQKHCLIYLRSNDTEPGEHSITKEDLAKAEEAKVILKKNHYSDTLSLVEEWIALTEADNVRHFLKQFRQFLNHEINGEAFMNQNDTIADLIFGRPETINTALAIHRATGRLMDKVIQELRPQLDKALSGTDMELDTSAYHLHEWEKKEQSFAISVSGINQFTIGFYWEYKWLEGGCQGFVYKVGGADPALKNALSNYFGERYADDSWPWYERLPEDRYQKIFWAQYPEVLSGKLAECFVNQAMYLRGQLEKFLETEQGMKYR